MLRAFTFLFSSDNRRSPFKYQMTSIPISISILDSSRLLLDGNSNKNRLWSMGSLWVMRPCQRNMNHFWITSGFGLWLNVSLYLPTRHFLRGWRLISIGGLSHSRQLKQEEYYTIKQILLVPANSESVNHLFLHCSVASEIWSLFSSIFG